ncbi:MAG: NAD(P)-binding protein, partial [Candidatus Aminicenantes bacterium]|nr:NAD(P)-binding protein [Candidatus Aminicenantes bacterium]
MKYQFFIKKDFPFRLFFSPEYRFRGYYRIDFFVFYDIIILSFNLILFIIPFEDNKKNEDVGVYFMDAALRENRTRADHRFLVILGGGPGGLAVGYYAKKNKIPFVICEAESRTGGNCVTLRHGEFLFDSGAHRFHDKIPGITREIKALMGDDIVKIDVPSQIYFKNKLVDFPLSPLNLLKNLGLFTFIKAGLEVLVSKLKKKNGEKNFETFALRTYGRTIANLFLLNYSEKLWGAPCNQLSPNVSGKRMKGLDLKTFLKEAVMGRKAKTEHLDGAFYYPRETGIGAITERLEQFCGQDNIRLNFKVTKIFHDHKEI